MSKLCPICNKEWPDEFQVCPVDGAALINKPQTLSGFSLNLGDANAISGGVNMSDNHSVSHNTVNTSNVDSHNVINTTNHITQIEREKRPEEIRRENMITFRKACQDAFVNGVLSETKKRQLDELQFQLNLDDATTLSIIEDVRAKSQNKATVLGRVQQVTLKNIKTAISNNQLDIITRLKPQLTAMIQKFSDEELQYTYYMLQAVLNPKECISQYEASVVDCYWQAFWTAVAYRRENNTEESDKLVADVEYKWSDSAPQEDVLILATINDIHDGDQDTAHSRFDTITGDHSQLLADLISTIYCILNKDTMDERDYQDQIRLGRFYAEHLFAVKSAAKKEEPRVAATPKVEAKSKPEQVEIQPKEEEVEPIDEVGNRKRKDERFIDEKTVLYASVSTPRETPCCFDQIEVDKYNKINGSASVVHVDSGKRFPLKEGVNLIGRCSLGTIVDIAIPTSSHLVSRKHSIIEVSKSNRGEYTYFISNAENKNPTKINDTLLANGARIELHSGDIINLASVLLVFEMV